MLVSYGIVFGIIIVVVGLFYGVLPLLSGNKALKNYQTLIGVAVDLVKAVEQQFKSVELDPNDPDYEQKKAQLQQEKHDACVAAIKEILTEYKLPLPSDAVISRAIEIGVYAMNQGKKFLEEKQASKK